MSTQEIIAELPKLSREELCSIAVELNRNVRDKGGVIYDDTYGIFTEADQAALTAEAWDMMDRKDGSATTR